MFVPINNFYGEHIFFFLSKNVFSHGCKGDSSQMILLLWGLFIFLKGCLPFWKDLNTICPRKKDSLVGWFTTCLYWLKGNGYTWLIFCQFFIGKLFQTPFMTAYYLHVHLAISKNGSAGSRSFSFSVALNQQGRLDIFLVSYHPGKCIHFT